MNRRQLIYGAGAGLVAGAAAKTGLAAPKDRGGKPKTAEEKGACKGLLLTEYEPHSMLKVKATQVPKAKFPIIDMHTHYTYSAKSKNGVELVPEREYLATPQELLTVMDQVNVRAMVDLTGGYGSGLKLTVDRYQKAHPGRFYIFTEPTYAMVADPNYPKLQADAIAEARKNGAMGLKVLKTLGLYLRENVTTGKLVKIDDPRFDPMWDACGQLNIPVSIHISDPAAFFTPTDRFNERYEELHGHPDWSFYGHDFPPKMELIEARNRVVARHPKTRFIGLHVANYGIDLATVGEWLDRYPNLSVDIAARINELGRQPFTARKFFDRYQDRIVFGTDATPNDTSSMQQIFEPGMYECYFRFLETDDEYFNYSVGKVPAQGRWQIYGINLPDQILRKVYHENAERALGVKV